MLYDTEKQFMEALHLGQCASFKTTTLRIDVNKSREPLEFRAKFTQNNMGNWQKFGECVSNYVGDIIEDVKHELKIFSNV